MVILSLLKKHILFFMSQNIRLPELPLEEWESTKDTLHLFLQIVGKIRLASMPRKNHWWYITEYIDTQGITTRAIPYEDGYNTFEIHFNFVKHQLEIITSKGEFKSFPLEDGLTVASFYQQTFQLLDELGIQIQIVARPFDMPVSTPFAEITHYHSYQKEYVTRFWTILRWVEAVFKEFDGRSYSKTSPVQLYWHHMDLAVTRFSGNTAPPLDPATRVSDKDAYSHEVISFGFWAGDQQVREAAFYSYTYPSPPGLDQEPLSPKEASWVMSNESPTAFLRYEDVRNAKNSSDYLLDFLESAYLAGAKLAQWNIESLKVPNLKDL